MTRLIIPAPEVDLSKAPTPLVEPGRAMALLSLPVSWWTDVIATGGQGRAVEGRGTSKRISRDILFAVNSQQLMRAALTESVGVQDGR